MDLSHLEKFRAPDDLHGISVMLSEEPRVVVRATPPTEHNRAWKFRYMQRMADLAQARAEDAEGEGGAAIAAMLEAREQAFREVCIVAIEGVDMEPAEFFARYPLAFDVVFAAASDAGRRIDAETESLLGKSTASRHGSTNGLDARAPTRSQKRAASSPSNPVAPH